MHWKLGASLAIAVTLTGCLGAPTPCERDSCIGSAPDESAFVIRLTGLDEARGCWGAVSYLNVPWEYVGSTPINDAIGCLYDLRTERAYLTPNGGYDLAFDAIGWRDCSADREGLPTAADPVPLCDP